MALFAAFIHRQFIYKPPVPTASYEGQTVIVTGANVGLGKEACRWLVRLGAAKVIITCRNLEKGKAAAKDIQATTSCSPDTLEVWHLDLSSYASVIAFADRANTELPRLDALIANAGLGTNKFRMTEDNEEMITTNVVSLFLHAFLLFPKLQETAKRHKTHTHLTITSSELYEVAKFNERNAPAGKLFAALSDQKQANMGDRYKVSKLLEIFIMKQMAKLYPLDTSKVIVNCIAPGFCQTELGREVTQKYAIARLLLRLLARPAEVGARTLVHGASAGPETHGQYVPDCKVTPTKGLTKAQGGVELQARVWDELKQNLEGIRPGVTSLLGGC